MSENAFGAIEMDKILLFFAFDIERITYATVFSIKHIAIGTVFFYFREAIGIIERDSEDVCNDDISVFSMRLITSDT